MNRWRDTDGTYKETGATGAPGNTGPMPVTFAPGTAATSLGKAEDAAHASADVGVMMLAVRKDTQAALAGTDLDYIPLIVDASGGLYVQNAAGENHIGQVGGHIATPASNTITRPADTTAYASGDLVANSTTAGSVTPFSWTTAARVAAGSFMVRRVRLKKSTTVTTLASFRLHLYASSPTCANGDNGAWSTTESGYLGSFDLDASGSNGRAFSDAVGIIGVPVVGTEVNVSLGSGQTIYGLLEARAAYVPGSAETFIISLELLQN